MVEGFAPILPVVEKIKIADKELVQVNGTAVFKRGKLVGMLDGPQTESLAWITKSKLNGVIVVPEKGKGKEADVTYEMLGNSTKLKPRMENGEVVIDVLMEFDLKIIVLDRVFPNYAEEKELKRLEAEANKVIKARVESLIDVVHNKYRTDIFGFGSVIFQNMPDEWKKMKKDWFKNFCTLRTKVSVKSQISESGLASMPIKVRD